MQIVRAKKGDVKEISRCRRESIQRLNSGDYSLENLEVLLLNSTVKGVLEELRDEEVFCLMNGKKIAGTVSLDRNQISGIYVSPEFSSQGYGQKLLEFMEEHAKKKGFSDVYVYSTISAREFYSHNGYALEGYALSVPSDKPTLFIYMRKELR